MKRLTILVLAHFGVLLGLGAFSCAIASTWTLQKSHALSHAERVATIASQEAQPLPRPLPDAAVPLPASTKPAQLTLADQPANISLRIDNGDIYNVIRIIADELKLNYVIDPSVKGTVNITTNTSVSRSDLLRILETILSLNGATMVANGNFNLIVPASTALRQPLPVQQGVPSQDADDQMILFVQRMQYLTASEMSKLLTPYLTERAHIVVVESRGMLLITERKGNLGKLLEMIQVFDHGF